MSTASVIGTRRASEVEDEVDRNIWTIDDDIHDYSTVYRPSGTPERLRQIISRGDLSALEEAVSGSEIRKTTEHLLTSFRRMCSRTGDDRQVFKNCSLFLLSKNFPIDMHTFELALVTEDDDIIEEVLRVCRETGLWLRLKGTDRQFIPCDTAARLSGLTLLRRLHEEEQLPFGSFTLNIAVVKKDFEMATYILGKRKFSGFAKYGQLIPPCHPELVTNETLGLAIEVGFWEFVKYLVMDYDDEDKTVYRCPIDAHNLALAHWICVPMFRFLYTQTIRRRRIGDEAVPERLIISAMIFTDGNSPLSHFGNSSLEHGTPIRINGRLWKKVEHLRYDDRTASEEERFTYNECTTPAR